MKVGVKMYGMKLGDELENVDLWNTMNVKEVMKLTGITEDELDVIYKKSELLPGVPLYVGAYAEHTSLHSKNNTYIIYYYRNIIYVSEAFGGIRKKSSYTSLVKIGNNDYFNYGILRYQNNFEYNTITGTIKNDTTRISENDVYVINTLIKTWTNLHAQILDVDGIRQFVKLTESNTQEAA